MNITYHMHFVTVTLFQIITSFSLSFHGQIRGSKEVKKCLLFIYVCSLSVIFLRFNLLVGSEITKWVVILIMY